MHAKKKRQGIKLINAEKQIVEYLYNTTNNFNLNICLYIDIYRIIINMHICLCSSHKNKKYLQ